MARRLRRRVAERSPAGPDAGVGRERSAEAPAVRGRELRPGRRDPRPVLPVRHPGRCRRRDRRVGLRPDGRLLVLEHVREPATTRLGATGRTASSGTRAISQGAVTRRLATTAPRRSKRPESTTAAAQSASSAQDGTDPPADDQRRRRPALRRSRTGPCPAPIRRPIRRRRCSARPRRRRRRSARRRRRPRATVSPSRELALEQLQRQLVDQLPLDHPLQRPGAVGRVVAEVAEQGARVVGQLDLDALLAQAAGELVDLELDDPAEVLAARAGGRSPCRRSGSGTRA